MSVVNINDLIEAAVNEGRSAVEKTAAVVDMAPPQPQYITVDYTEALKVAAALEYVSDHLEEVVDDRPMAEKLAEFALLSEKLAMEDIPMSSPTGDGIGPGALGSALGLMPSANPGLSTSATDLGGSKTNVIPSSTSNSEAARPKDVASAMQTDEADPPGGVKAASVYREALIDAITKKASAEKLARLGRLKMAAGQPALVDQSRTSDITERGQESPLGGSPEGERGVGSNQEAIDFTKAQGATSKRKDMKAYLNEPAMSRGTDPVLHNQLAHAGSAGVKLAAAKAYLVKVAGEGCSCDRHGTCTYCSMKEKLAHIGDGSEEYSESGDPSGEVSQSLSNEDYGDAISSLLTEEE